MKVLAKRGDNDYLVLVKDDETRPMGCVVNLEDKKVFNLWNVHSLLARGYWDDLTDADKRNEGEVLALVRDADARGQLKEPDFGTQA